MLHGPKGRKLSTNPVDQGNKQLTVHVFHPAYTSPLRTNPCSNLQAEVNLLCPYPSQLKVARRITEKSDLNHQLHQSAYKVWPGSGSRLCQNDRLSVTQGSEKVPLVLENCLRLLVVAQSVRTVDWQ